MNRVELLERSNRRWRLAALAMAVVLTVVLVQGDSHRQAAAQPNKGPAAQPNWIVDRSQMTTAYTNFCQASGTPEELVLDFGLNPAMAPDPKQPIKISQRIVMNYYTAKRLTSLLHQSVEQHEKTFGPLELDFNKRMLPKD